MGFNSAFNGLITVFYAVCLKIWPGIQIIRVEMLDNEEEILNSVEWSCLVTLAVIWIFSGRDWRKAEKSWKKTLSVLSLIPTRRIRIQSQKHYIIYLLDRCILIKKSKIVSEGKSQTQIQNLKNTILYTKLQTLFGQRYVTCIRWHCTGH